MSLSRRSRQILEREQAARLVEKAEDEPLAVLRRQRADADVDEPVADADSYAPVLRHEALRDIHVRHYFYAARDGGLVAL